MYPMSPAGRAFSRHETYHGQKIPNANLDHDGGKPKAPNGSYPTLSTDDSYTILPIVSDSTTWVPWGVLAATSTMAVATSRASTARYRLSDPTSNGRIVVVTILPSDSPKRRSSRSPAQTQVPQDWRNPFGSTSVDDGPARARGTRVGARMLSHRSLVKPKWESRVTRRHQTSRSQ